VNGLAEELPVKKRGGTEPASISVAGVEVLRCQNSKDTGAWWRKIEQIIGRELS
jgi:hypothetical protein